MITALPIFISALLLPLFEKYWKVLGIISLLSAIPLLNGDIFSYTLIGVTVATLLHLEDSGRGVQTLLIGVASLSILQASSLLSFVINFEALSIISFILLSNMRNREESEASVSLFIAGAVATGVIFLGVAIFSIGGGVVDEVLSSSNSISLFGIILILVGVFYKFSLLPMHNWAVVTYGKGELSNIAIISGVVKSVIVLATYRVFEPVLDQLEIFFIAVAMASMLFGNISALFQKRVSKMLAYSSIAQAGYILLPFIAVNSDFSTSAIEYMAIAYILMQTAVFLLLDIAKIRDIEDLKGLGDKSPIVALFFTVQLLSLGGIPLLAGFLSKAVTFYSLVDINLWWLALFALLNSALSLGYYGWLIKFIYFDKSENNGNIEISKIRLTSQYLLLFGTLLFGVFAGLVID